jgi:hypothetical protein
MAISNVQGTLTVDETIINGTVSINGTIINGAVYINGQGEQGLQGIQGNDGTNGTNGLQGIQGIQGESGTFDGIPLSGTTVLNPITGKLEYSSNLSTTFTARSLVDKGYADTKVPLSGTAAENPITGNLLVNGNLGIGTTTPTRKLDVNADASINGLRIGRGSGNLSTNVVLGVGALNSNTTGAANFSLGESSLFLNQTGNDNIAIGIVAIRSNISGIRNVGIGSGSLFSTTASGNTGIGRNTISSNTTGSNNIAIGNNAGNVIGSGSVGATILNSSILIGNDTRPLLDNQTNQIVIGTSAIGLGSNTTLIGNSSTVNAQIFGNVKATGSVQVSDNTAAASASNVGSIRYRATSTNSFMEMSMQTGTSTFAWVIIKQNTF